MGFHLLGIYRTGVFALLSFYYVVGLSLAGFVGYLRDLTCFFSVAISVSAFFLVGLGRENGVCCFFG